MDELNDIELVDHARNGDSDAFEQLVQRHYTTVYRTGYRWCGNREDAEDIAQDVFVKVARKLATFAGRSSFKTWLYRITLNTAKDFGRKRATRRVHETSSYEETTPDHANPGGEAVIAARQLVDAIDRLPPRQKAAAMLVWAEGLTHKEAAQVLSCAEATVSGHLLQARAKLKGMLSVAS